MSPAPRAMEQYLAWESRRMLWLVMPRSLATSALSPWAEWPDSTLSQKQASAMLGTGLMEMGLLGRRAPSPSLRLVEPAPLIVPKSTPVSMPSEPDWPTVGVRAASETGKLGHPIAPTLRSPSTIRPRQTAYCSPRRKPFVPSMGSRAHVLPLGPPALFPLSRVSRKTSSLAIWPPTSQSLSVSLRRVSLTSSQIWLLRALFSLRELASSSATISSSGKFFLIA
ncbi:hypothetical protein H112_05195 [Trichophyton rubrum D6]|uniref:Uncharacterized protein n=3 Tax=Trichophyton TaxID=5550 RepID=A0A080WLK7_TRIRC|nr:uncharacterized protein TERG_11922 [Trichophyton rubrum CBS 118892]EZF20516.1 hypothetical protein H100_05217 [Trichophyton rubrum MR850]EZF40933.1 hypothetical protein H102_05204 [Trichophyton rubrum CBS 100081]EZF51727.1 hypothetical protein H103_05205 [Trichophyton rubrum CBS 288.86]EZF62136.1 hypothetical protein H104_05198 [Trichophyton rubrum CBS 289.86]EZF72974.1 hypothetical protein H105_05226 [Trichophyton soudanense CBS 452.61]EZF83383.1 hypothetical protein H110_05204 [Trichophy